MADAQRKKETAPAPAPSTPAKSVPTKANTTKPNSGIICFHSRQTESNSGSCYFYEGRPGIRQTNHDSLRSQQTNRRPCRARKTDRSLLRRWRQVGPSPPTPVKRSSGSSEEGGDAAAQQRTKETRIEAHWKKWRPQADNDRSYPVVFDKSPAEVRAKLIELVGGTEPKLSTMATALSYLEAASNKPDPGPVKVAFVDADHFDAICEAFDTDKITIKMPNKEGKGFTKRKAFVPVRETRKA
ncbi:hypothetical protein B0I37DRAFT_407104 [Chaetomium sp. MPI-CAGE-AT-0009]|nr:hypothetical protein B0I37DRAFT_407104 [Chaetomium sp. MPI-CAGE-AT-0009]